MESSKKVARFLSLYDAYKNLIYPTHIYLQFSEANLLNFLFELMDKGTRYICLNKYLIKIICMYILFGTNVTDDSKSYHAIRIIAYHLLDNENLIDEKEKIPTVEKLQTKQKKGIFSRRKTIQASTESDYLDDLDDYFKERMPKTKCILPEDNFDIYEKPHLKKVVADTTITNSSNTEDFVDIAGEKVTHMYDIGNLIPFDRYIEYHINSLISYLMMILNNKHTKMI